MQEISSLIGSGRVYAWETDTVRLPQPPSWLNLRGECGPYPCPHHRGPILPTGTGESRRAQGIRNNLGLRRPSWKRRNVAGISYVLKNHMPMLSNFVETA
jgi:hypothetical protein